MEPRLPTPPVRRHRGEEGYNLVILMVLVTVLNVLVAAALPTWTSMKQREDEEELIFRGLQYAEAIRVFQARFGRLPVRLEELVEVEPRSIRQLWSDPITGEDSWGLIFANAGGPGQGGPGGPGRDLGGGDAPDSLFDDEDEDNRPRSGDPDRVTQGPITGVYSLAEGEAIKTFDGKKTYEEWHFTVDRLLRGTGLAGGQPPGSGTSNVRPGGPPQQPPGQPGQPGQPGGPQGALMQPGMGPPDLSARWIGRAWPPRIQMQMQAGQPGQPGQPGGPPAGGLDLRNEGRDGGGNRR